MIIALLSFQLGLPVPLPPAQYDHAFKGKLVTVYTNDEQTRQVCRTVMVSGCTRGAHNGTCVIFIREHLRGTWIAPYVIRHEIGHCNGWRH